MTPEARAEVEKQFEEWRQGLLEQERAFFAKVGVDQRITTLGQLPTYEQQFPPASGYVGWDYSIEDLARLGLREIEVENGREWEPGPAPQGKRIFRLRLADHPDFAGQPQREQPGSGA
jgi:hypothetical protein